MRGGLREDEDEALDREALSKMLTEARHAAFKSDDFEYEQDDDPVTKDQGTVNEYEEGDEGGHVDEKHEGGHVDETPDGSDGVVDPNDDDLVIRVSGGRRRR